MADILDEVESDYHAEQLRAVAARYAWLVGVVLIAVLVAAGGWQAWQGRQARIAARAGATYSDLAKAAGGLVAGDQAGRRSIAGRLGAFAEAAPDGYRTLARLRQAALLADAGDLMQAQAVWDRIATDPGADPMLRQTASLLWVERGLDRSDPAALRTRLLTLASADNPFHRVAREAQAMLELRLGHNEAARSMLRSLVADAGAPSAMRGRDEAILSRLGG